MRDRVRRGWFLRGLLCAALAGGAALAPSATRASGASGPANEGRLVAHHYAQHAELALPALPLEPMAPRGRWASSPGGTQVWVPEWLDRSGLLYAALTEIDETEPEADARIAPGTKGPDPERRPRVVICDPGAFSYAVEDGRGPSGSGMTRGLYARGAWPETLSDTRDVIWVAWRLSQKETQPYLPSYAHELRVHRTADASSDPDGAQPYTP